MQLPLPLSHHATYVVVARTEDANGVATSPNPFPIAASPSTATVRATGDSARKNGRRDLEVGCIDRRRGEQWRDDAALAVGGRARASFHDSRPLAGLTPKWWPLLFIQSYSWGQ
uniref:Uncharacterized protein n=1 Tax=Oryza nivara TaxID=4536 RepID=A0A0E0HCH2_ORYNI